MPEKQGEKLTRFNLIGVSEDSYSSQNAQNQSSARRLLSLIPSIKGDLAREFGQPTYLPTTLASPAGSLFEFDQNDANGNVTRSYFAATASKLYKNVAGAWVAQTLPTSLGLTTTTPFTDYPQAVVINNLLHVSDGTTNWLFDGTTWVIEGFPVGTLDVLASAADNGAGNINVSVGRYYWFNFADHTAGRVHEGSTTTRSGNTGPLVNRQIKVTPVGGTVNTLIGNTVVNGVATVFGISDLHYVGRVLYVNGVSFGPIASIQTDLQLTLASPAPATVVGGKILVAPLRATHLHIYASEVDSSSIGQYLGALAVTANPPEFIDNSPDVTSSSTLFTRITRPIRNDPPPASKILTVHKLRIFRRRETRPNFFNLSANEEVSSGANGSPQESVPGADVNTISDLVNENPYPKESNRIRALCSHGDALYIGTEKEIIPLYGQSIDDFALVQVTTFQVGVAGRWGMISTRHGLVFVSYSKKVLLYPTSQFSFAYTPKDVNATDQLVEIGRTIRAKLKQIKSSDLDNVRLLHYDYGERDWLILCFQDKNSAYHTWVYDFETKSWFETQRGFVSVAVFEVAAGDRVLVGAGTDGKVYVADDLTGTYAAPATLPSTLWRTALIDFNRPEVQHVLRYIEIETSNLNIMSQSATVNFYLDPPDADVPVNPHRVYFTSVRGKPNTFRGWFTKTTKGVICSRVMIELGLKSDGNSGTIRGVVLKADPVSGLAR